MSDKSTNNYCVYLYFRMNGIPLYVGMGRESRAKSHLNRSHNERLARTLKKYNGALPLVIIREKITRKDAVEAEIALIAAIGRADMKCGPLANHTNGGDGVTGWSEESRKKLSKSRLGKGYRLSEETKRKIGLRSLGKKRPPEWKAAIGNALRGKVRASEHSRNISKAKTGVPMGPISNHRRENIRGAVSDFWEELRSAGKRMVWITNELTNSRILSDAPLPEGWRFGKSNKSKEKLRNSLIAFQVKLVNSGKRLRWITDGISNCKLSEDLLIPEGWRRGRTLRSRK